MPLDGGTAVVRVIADASSLNSTLAAQVRGSQGALSRLGQSVTGALMNPIVLAGAAATAVVAKLGFDFEDAFTRIDAISNASSQDIANWKDQILSLSKAVAIAPADLADALYFLASAGLKVSEVFPALTASAQASAIGLGSVAQVSSVVAAVLNAYARSNMTAASATDILVAATRESRAEADAFGQVVGRLLPISARAGISFGELAGSLASLSNIGLDVYEAATAMRAAIQAIVAPGAKAAGAMAAIGISSQQMLDAIHGRGLLGALQLLDKAAKNNTDSESAYLRTLRDIIPNIRALTGILGLTGENAKHVQSVFWATTHATGDLAVALKTTTEGPAFQFRQALNNIRVTGTEVGIKVLPLITNALNLLGPILGIVADNAGFLLALFLGYKVLTWLPVLIEAVASAFGLLAVEAGGAATFNAFGILAAATAAPRVSALMKFGLGVESLAGNIGLLATAAEAAGPAWIAWDAFTSQTASNATSTGDSMTFLQAKTQEFIKALQDGTPAADAFASVIGSRVSTSLGDQAVVQQALNQAWTHGTITAGQYKVASMQLGKSTGQVTSELSRMFAEIGRSKDKFDTFIAGGGKVVRMYQRWGFASDKAFGEFKKGLLQSVQVAVGQFATLADAFKTTPTELQKQLRLSVQIARRFHSDLKKIFSDPSLSLGQKKALASLPADQRDAWVRAKGAAKTEMLHNAVTLSRLNSNISKDISQAGVDPLKKGGHDGGQGYGKGVERGIYASMPGAMAAARALAHGVVAAGNQVLKIKSPSKEGERTGRFYVLGIIKGLKDEETALTNAAQHVADVLATQLDNARSKLQDAIDKKVGEAAARIAVELARSRVKQANELQKMVNQAEKALDRIVNKFKEFRDSIKSGFDSFKDLGGILASQWSDYASAMEQYQQDLVAYQDALAKYNENPTGEPPVAPTAPTAPNFAQTIQEQVAQAQQLAKLLKQAAEAGLSKELLAQFAGQGAAAIPVLQQLLGDPALIAQLNQAYQDIAKAAGNTANTLGDQFFGAAIKEATANLKDAHVELVKFILHLVDVNEGLKGLERQLQRILDVLRGNNNNANDGGGGGGNGNGNGNNGTQGGGGGGQGNSFGAVTININGDINPEVTARRVRDELLRIGRNNGSTGL